MNIYRQDSTECAFNSENVAQVLDFFGTLGEPGHSLSQTSNAEKFKGSSKDLVDPGNIRKKNRKSEEESSEFRRKRKKRKQVTAEGERNSCRF